MRRLAIVLHSHVPYVRRNGVWPAGEDLFHQVASESYLPLIAMLERLAADGHAGVCSVGITPVLAHQMQDAHMRTELAAYLARIELRAMRQVANYRGPQAEAVKDLAAFYTRAAREAAARLDACGDGMARAFAALETAGVIEILGGPATHPLLPMLSESQRRLQVATGAGAHEAIFGRRPDGVWIPECATGNGAESAPAAAGARHTVVDPASLPRDATRPVRAGTLTVLPRDRVLTDAVWSAGGYPSGVWYRDFQHYDTVGGFKNWRVTAPAATLGDKQPYDPAAAARAARADAAAFVAAADARFETTGSDVLVAAFDTELFGHWWLEGVIWLEEVLTRLAAHPSIRPVTLRDAAEAAAATAAVVDEPLRPASWGAGAGFRNWQSPATEELFEGMTAAGARAEPIVARSGPARDQALRELLLLQSSDWPYMIARDENAGYARERFAAHHERFDSVAGALERGEDAAAAEAAARWFELDNCFAALPPAGKA